jgi:hypothetical protein
MLTNELPRFLDPSTLDDAAFDEGGTYGLHLGVLRRLTRFAIEATDGGDARRTNR